MAEIWLEIVVKRQFVSALFFSPPSMYTVLHTFVQVLFWAIIWVIIKILTHPSYLIDFQYCLVILFPGKFSAHFLGDLKNVSYFLKKNDLQQDYSAELVPQLQLVKAAVCTTFSFSLFTDLSKAQTCRDKQESKDKIVIEFRKSY